MISFSVYLIKSSSLRFFFVVSLLFVSSYSSYAGGLSLYPTRVEFADRELMREVRIINSDIEDVNYRISWTHLRMKDGKTYETIPESETNHPEKYLDDIVQYSPKRVTLKAGESQLVRLFAKIPKDLPAGEYRSHLLFKQEADQSPLNDVEERDPKKQKEATVSIKALFAISIPVILKHGETSVHLSFKDILLKKEKDKSYLDVTMNREGNSTAYGYFDVFFKPKDSDKSYNIASTGAMQIFYPYDMRKVNIDLDFPKEVKGKSGQIEVKFLNKKDENKSKSDEVLTSKVIDYYSK